MASMPIIALTALSGADVRRRCAEAKITARVVKPVNLDHLAAELWRWIGKSRSAAPGNAAGEGPEEAIAELSPFALDCMVSDIGLERTRAGVQEFMADAAARCGRLGELLPGWEADAILRVCRDVGGRAAELGAVGLAEALDTLAGQAACGDREGAERTVGRIEAAVARIGAAMLARLAHGGRKDDLEAA